MHKPLKRKSAQAAALEKQLLEKNSSYNLAALKSTELSVPKNSHTITSWLRNSIDMAGLYLSECKCILHHDELPAENHVKWLFEVKIRGW